MELSIELRVALTCRAMDILMSCDCLMPCLFLLVGTQRSHRSARVLDRNIHHIPRTLHTTPYTFRIMPKRQRRLSSSGTEAESDTSSEAAASPPPTSPASHTTPDRDCGHVNRLLRSVRRQSVEHVGPPRSDRQMRMLDVDWEVQRLERVRRFFPSSNPTLPADNASVPDYARETAAATLERQYPGLLEAIRQSEQRWRDERHELRERRAHAEVANLLTYHDAGTMVYIDNTQIVMLTL
jgi:hypothetical protein